MYNFFQYFILPTCSVLLLATAMYAGMRGEAKIDCSLAEFHPDFTAQMKEKCRNARNKVQN